MSTWYSMNFKIALVQMRVDGGAKDENLSRAIGGIAKASSNGARLALLPEALDLGWTHPSARPEAEPFPDGKPASLLRQAASRHRVWVCAGLTEKAGDKVYNTAVLVSPSGEIVSSHRKLNELTIGHTCYDQGDRLSVVQTELGAVGMMVCADGFARDCVLSRSLCYMGADIILSPCAWAVPADHDNNANPYGKLWHDSYIPVAREFQVYICATSNVGPLTAGPWAGRKCIGSSMVINPKGEEILRGPFGETDEAILYTEVKPLPRPARGCGWEELRNFRADCDLVSPEGTSGGVDTASSRL